MFNYERGLRLSGQARQAYVSDNLLEAVQLATQAMQLLNWSEPAHAEAHATLEFAKRRLNHPNPSWLRRLWWVLNGEWAFSLGSNVSLGEEMR